MIYVYLAGGFEEIEAITSIDILRRSEKDVTVVGVGDNIIVGAHGIPVVCDTIAQEVPLNDELEMIVLPGGMPGTLNLEKNSYVQEAIDFCVENNKFIAAICAAPSILGHRGILAGKTAVCYEGFESQLDGAKIGTASVVQDGNIITAKGPGVSVDFGLKLVSVLKSEADSARIRKSMLCENYEQ